MHALKLTPIWTHRHTCSTPINIIKRLGQYILRLIKLIWTSCYQGDNRLPVERYNVTKPLVLYINDILEKCDDIIYDTCICR